jgi:hypothetical protein
MCASGWEALGKDSNETSLDSEAVLEEIARLRHGGDEQSILLELEAQRRIRHLRY